MFIPISKCDFETSDIDINTIGDNYNNNSYVADLANIGVKVTAVQTDHTILLTYNDSESITYSYSEIDGVLNTSYPSINSEHLNILNAIYDQEIEIELSDDLVPKLEKQEGFENNQDSISGSDNGSDNGSEGEDYDTDD